MDANLVEAIEQANKSLDDKLITLQGQLAAFHAQLTTVQKNRTDLQELYRQLLRQAMPVETAEPAASPTLNAAAVIDSQGELMAQHPSLKRPGSPKLEPLTARKRNLSLDPHAEAEPPVPSTVNELAEFDEQGLDEEEVDTRLKFRRVDEANDKYGNRLPVYVAESPDKPIQVLVRLQDLEKVHGLPEPHENMKSYAALLDKQQIAAYIRWCKEIGHPFHHRGTLLFVNNSLVDKVRKHSNLWGLYLQGKVAHFSFKSKA